MGESVLAGNTEEPGHEAPGLPQLLAGSQNYSSSQSYPPSTESLLTQTCLSTGFLISVETSSLCVCVVWGVGPRTCHKEHTHILCTPALQKPLSCYLILPVDLQASRGPVTLLMNLNPTPYTSVGPASQSHSLGSACQPTFCTWAGLE